MLRTSRYYSYHHRQTVQISDATYDRILSLLLRGQIPVRVGFNENAADGWGMWTIEHDTAGLSPVDAEIASQVMSDLEANCGDCPVKLSGPKGRDITQQWTTWADRKVKAITRLENRENERRGKALAEAKRTGQPQLLRESSGTVDDGEGGECYGHVGTFIGPDGKVFRKVTNRAY